MNSAHFGSTQFIVSASVLGLMVALQVVIPYQRDARALFRNWRANLPLGALTFFLLGGITGPAMVSWCLFLREQHLGLFANLNAAPWIQVALTLIILDLVTYLWHRLYHSASWLWRAHSVHHSDIVLDATSALRFHPAEVLISLGVRALALTALGPMLFAYLFFELVYSGMNLFAHAHIRLPARLERFVSFAFVTPSMHRQHHSIQRPEADSNFGVIFSFWDRLFGTLGRRSQVVLGLPGHPREYLSFWKLLAMPFKRSGAS